MAHAHTSIQYICIDFRWSYLRRMAFFVVMCVSYCRWHQSTGEREREKKFLTKNNEKEMRDWGEKVFRTNGNPAALQTWNVNENQLRANKRWKFSNYVFLPNWIERRMEFRFLARKFTSGIFTEYASNDKTLDSIATFTETKMLRWSDPIIIALALPWKKFVIEKWNCSSRNG